MWLVTEVPYFGHETGYTDNFSGFPHSHHTNYDLVPKDTPWPLSPTSFRIYYSQSSSHFEVDDRVFKKLRNEQIFVLICHSKR
jgi:hypothetical protein